MNALFLVIAIAAIILISISSPEAVIGVMLDGAMNAVDLGVKLAVIYAVWMSVLTMMTKSGLSDKLTRLFRPITNLLFKGESEEAKGYIAVNFASNMLGLGGAATPAGISAIKAMDKDYTSATKNMVMFIVINTTSLQLLPATVMALLASHGSTAPSAIIIPSLIASAVATAFGMLLVTFIREK